MGYTTDFSGSLLLSRPATTDEKQFINAFSDTRRMCRNVDVLMKEYKGQYGLPKPPIEKIIDPALIKHIKALSKAGIKIDISTISDNRTAEQIYGATGEYYAHPKGDDGVGILDYNTPPGQIHHNHSQNDLFAKFQTKDVWQINDKLTKEGKCQPGLWCNWELDDTGTELKWNGAEKFYNYIEWLEYLIQHFFTPWNIKLNGKIKWNGEDSNDVGLITVKNNKVTYKEGTIVYK